MLPTFLVIGTAKAGTTSLHDYLGQHPDVFMSPVKEPRFFAYDGRPLPAGGPGGFHGRTVLDVEAYEALFAGATPGQARGEASPMYLYSPLAAERIAARVPEAKLVAILRDPAERAFSHFLHLRRDNLEPCTTLAEALAREPERIAEDWDWSFHYRALGYYDAQLARYAERFPADRVHVVLYEDLSDDPEGVVRGVYRFLGLEGFQPDVRAKLNTGGVPKEGAAWRVASQYDHPLRRIFRPLLPHRLRLALLSRLRQRAMERPTLDKATRADLVAGYRGDLLRLQERLGRDLTAWLTV